MKCTQHESDNLEGFQRWLRKENLSESTIRRYCQAVRKMLQWTGKPATELTQEDIDDFKLYLRDTYDTNSLIPLGASINNFMRFLGKTISVKLPSIRRKNVVPLTVREIERIMATAKATDPLDHAMIATAYYGALRRNELRDLKVEDVDFDRGKVRIHGKGDTYDEVNLHPNAIEAVRRYLIHRSEPKDRVHGDHLFISPQSGRPIHRTYLNDRLKSVAQKAGITKRCYGHLLRHSCITHMSDHGAQIAEIQRQSRHKDIKTLSSYIHPDDAKCREAYLRTVAGGPAGKEPFNEANKHVTRRDVLKSGLQAA
ncbi:MAG: tyrosine-type recombinase/integrase [Thermoplasmata archaeon]